MEAIFKLGKLYFDIISLIGIVLILVQSIIGLKKGFLYSVIKMGKGVITVVISALLAKPLSLLLGKMSIFSKMETSIVTSLEKTSDIFTKPLPSEGGLSTIVESLQEMNLPKNLVKPLSNFIESINNAQMNGSSLADLIGQGVVHYLLLALSFVILFVIFTILFMILMKLAKDINEIEIIGKFNKVLGLGFGLVLAYITFDIFVYIISFVMMLDGNIYNFFSSTMYIDAEGIGTFAKFVYNHNLTRIIISAFL